MRATALMRIVARVLSGGTGDWWPRVVPAPCRARPTTPCVHFTDIAADPTTACRGNRLKASVSHKQPVLDGSQQATRPADGGEAHGAGASAAAGAPPPTPAPRARIKSADASPSPSPAKYRLKPQPAIPGSDSDPAAQAQGAPAPAQRRRKRQATPQQELQSRESAAAAAAADVDVITVTAAPDPVPAAPAKPRTRRSKAALAAGAEAAPKPPAAPQVAEPSGGPAAQPHRSGGDDSPVNRTRPVPAPAATPAVHGTTGSGGVLLIVDGNYLANRSYFGYGSRGLSTSGGVPTSVTYGVVRVLQAAIRHVGPSALAVVFDPPGPTFRSALSLLDPEAAAAGPAAAHLVRQGRLDWQNLASQLLVQEAVLQDMQTAAAAEAAATPSSYLHPSGSFLSPAPAPLLAPLAGAAVTAVTAGGSSGSGGGGGGTQQLSSTWWTPKGAAAANMLEVLVAALGRELGAALGLTELAAAAGTGTSAPIDALVPPYKAGRLSKGEDFYSDLTNLQRLLGVMAVPPISRPWLEADDLAGLLVQQAVQSDMAVRIVSGDRDLMQLVSDPHDVRLLYPESSSPPAAAAAASGRRRGGGGVPFPFRELREADVVSALGVAPALVADYKALTGDASDRLPGVSGIGPKTAAQLLASYGSLMGVYGAAGELTAKRRACLQAALPASQYTLTLARVLGSPGAPSAPAGVVPAGLLQRLQLRGFDSDLVARVLDELEMRSLARGAVPGGELWAAFGGGGGDARA